MMKEFDELVHIMHRLRKECPWDREQTIESLRQYLLEEASECVEAINDLKIKGPDNLIEELGDVLLQVLFQAEILSESHSEISVKNVLNQLKDKLIRRHPHVFGDIATTKTSTEVLAQWDQIKQSEKKGKRESQLDGISKSLSALMMSHKLGERAAKVDFEWPTADGAWSDFESEIAELKAAKTKEERESEFGDILFSLTQWGRKSDFNAEVALFNANARFKWRFQKMEEIAKARSLDFTSLSLDEKGKLWREAKLLEKKN